MLEEESFHPNLTEGFLFVHGFSTRGMFLWGLPVKNISGTLTYLLICDKLMWLNMIAAG